jgi:hypothetical protein
MIAKLTQTIQPFEPVFQSLTSPLAQPWYLANGESTAQPSTAPRSM